MNLTFNNFTPISSLDTIYHEPAWSISSNFSGTKTYGFAFQHSRQSSVPFWGLQKAEKLPWCWGYLSEAWFHFSCMNNMSMHSSLCVIPSTTPNGTFVSEQVYNFQHLSKNIYNPQGTLGLFPFPGNSASFPLLSCYLQSVCLSFCRTGNLPFAFAPLFSSGRNQCLFRNGFLP